MERHRPYKVHFKTASLCVQYKFKGDWSQQKRVFITKQSIRFLSKGLQTGVFQYLLHTVFFHLSFLFYPQKSASICGQTLLRTQIREK